MLLVPLNSLKDRTIKRVNISSSQVRQKERKTVREREGERERKRQQRCQSLAQI